MLSRSTKGKPRWAKLGKRLAPRAMRGMRIDADVPRDGVQLQPQVAGNERSIAAPQPPAPRGLQSLGNCVP